MGIGFKIPVPIHTNIEFEMKLWNHPFLKTDKLEEADVTFLKIRNE